MGFAEQNTADNTKKMLAEAQATNKKLDAILAELHRLNEQLALRAGAGG